MERDGEGVRRSEVFAPAGGGAGSADAGASSSGVRRAAVELWGAERTRQPIGSSAAGSGSRAGGASGDLHGAVVGDGDRSAGHSQGGGSLCSSGSSLSE